MVYRKTWNNFVNLGTKKNKRLTGTLVTSYVEAGEEDTTVAADG